MGRRGDRGGLFPAGPVRLSLLERTSASAISPPSCLDFTLKRAVWKLLGARFSVPDSFYKFCQDMDV